MGRALLVAALGAPLLAWSWMSLESGHDAGQATLVVLLAIAAALVRRRSARIAACVVALLATGAIAFGLGRVWALPGRMLSRFGSAFLDWQHWDLYTKPAKPVDVSYVWNSSYSGLTYHGKPTTVFRVKAGPEPRYWRVSVLNTVEHGTWFEEVAPAFGNPPVPLAQP